MVCNMAGCSGELDKQNPVVIHGWGISQTQAFACATCKRVHHSTGELYSSRRGRAVYLDEEGKCRDTEEMELFVFSFPEEKYLTNRYSRKATFVAAISSPDDLQYVEGEWLLCWNPRTEHWVLDEEVSALF
jgi:hypothetical protein